MRWQNDFHAHFQFFRWQRRLLGFGLWSLSTFATALNLDVTVDGIDGQPLANVLAQLAIYQERNDSDLTPERLEYLHRLASEQIHAALIPFGFYQTTIDAPAQPQHHGDRWQVYYHISAGAPVTVGSVDYQISGEGATNPAFPTTLPLRVGDVLRHADYEAVKAQLRDSAASEGYVDAHWIAHQVIVDPVANRAAVHLHLDTGPRYRLGAVTFKQNLLDPALLHRYLNFVPGAIYDPNRLLNLQSRLLGSEYFSAVEIIPETAQTTLGRWVPITVVATSNLPNQYRLGLGYATDVGPRLRMDWQRRYLNRWGHRLRSTLSLASTESTLALDYRIPLHDPTRDYLSIKPQLRVADAATGKGWTQTLALAHVSPGANGWRRSFGVDYSYEDLNAASGNLGATNELVPTLAWSKTVTDDPVLTRHGYRIKYSLLGGLEGLLAEANYLSGQLQYKWIQGFAKRYRLITRADLGVTLTEQVNALPLTRRFYAGGDQSLRGWGFNTLGPRVSGSNTVLGGRYLAVGSIEMERQLAGRWSAAVFTDFGNAFNRLNTPAPELSAGFGVRWASPIGQIRFDLAFALSEDTHENGLPPARLHLVIGPDL